MPEPAGENLRIECPECKRTLLVKPELAGKRLKCGECGAITSVGPAAHEKTSANWNVQSDVATNVRQASPKSGKKLNRILLGIGGVCVGGILTIVALCGGLFLWAMSEFERQAEVAIESNIVVQKHIGTVFKVEHDAIRTAALPGLDEYCFHVKGPSGEGDLYAEFLTVDMDSEEISYGMLKLSSGETYDLNNGEEIDGENIDIAMSKLRQDFKEGLAQILGMKDKIDEAFSEPLDGSSL